MSDRDLHVSVTITGRAVRRLLVALVAVLAVLPTVAFAGDTFSDVPDSNIFHDDIDWMADNGVTRGCGGDRFCPSDTVTREQMSAFMRRLDTEDVFLTPDEQAADADRLDGLSSGAFARSGTACPAGRFADGIGDDGLVDCSDPLAAVLDLVPLATVRIGVPVSDPAVVGSRVRAPISGTPTVDSPVTGTYDVSFPGLTYQIGRHVTTCTSTADDRRVTSTTSQTGDLRVFVVDAAGDPADGTFACAVWFAD